MSEEDAKVVYDYWNTVASRPTGDKKDTSKKRVGKKEYLHHARHVLEKTQTEAYLEFCSLHPEIRIKQRKFENLKPFYGKQARERNRRSCLCCKHMETKMVFMDCMKFRKSLAADDNQLPPIPKSLNEAVEMTLCAKEEEKYCTNLKCIERMCEDCGVDKFPLLPEESSNNGVAKWSRYEYVPTGKYLPDSKEKK